MSEAERKSRDDGSGLWKRKTGAIVKPSEVDGMSPTQAPPSRTRRLHFAPVAGHIGSQQISARFFSETELQLKRATSPKAIPLGTAHIQWLVQVTL